MPSNFLLLLPLLGGYLFIHYFHFTYFRAQALDGHRLIFEAAIAGFALLLPCRILILFLATFDAAVAIKGVWHSISGQVPFLSTLALVLVSGPTCAFILNLIIGTFFYLQERRNNSDKSEGVSTFGLRAILATSRERALSYAVYRTGNSLQMFLHRAAVEAQDIPTVCLTLKNRKIYVGWITKSPNLRANDTHISLIPIMSGYRDKDTMEFKFTVSYPFEGDQKDGENLRKEHFTVLIPVSEVETARFFEIGLYDSLFKALPKQPA